MTDQELMIKLLFNEYGKIVLTVDETAKCLGISKKTLESDRYQSEGIAYTRRIAKEGGKIMYSITTIAKHLIDNQIKTI